MAVIGDTSSFSSKVVCQLNLQTVTKFGGAQVSCSLLYLGMDLSTALIPQEDRWPALGKAPPTLGPPTRNPGAQDRSAPRTAPTTGCGRI